MSYIVKNCPAYEYNEEWDHHICKRNLAVYETTCDTCPECSDCTMKQIVELCGKYHIIDAGYQKVAINYLSSDILKLLDIQEVE
jgi:hypothetical protein